VKRFISLVAVLFVTMPAFGQVVNGSFEAGGTVNAFAITSLPGWNVTQGNVDIVTTGPGGYWNNASATNGTNVIDLSGNARSQITQTVPLTDTAFNLSFDYSRNIDYTGSALFRVQVRVFETSNPGNVLFTEIFQRNASLDGASTSNFNWSSYNGMDISGNSATNVTLEFTDISNLPANGGPPLTQGIVLDNITLTPTPEPATVLGLSAGVLVIGGALRRKLKA
jgi:hypothetical protein